MFLEKRSSSQKINYLDQGFPKVFMPQTPNIMIPLCTGSFIYVQKANLYWKKNKNSKFARNYSNSLLKAFMYNAL